MLLLDCQYAICNSVLNAGYKYITFFRFLKHYQVDSVCSLTFDSLLSYTKLSIRSHCGTVYACMHSLFSEDYWLFKGHTILLTFCPIPVHSSLHDFLSWWSQCFSCLPLPQGLMLHILMSLPHGFKKIVVKSPFLPLPRPRLFMVFRKAHYGWYFTFLISFSAWGNLQSTASISNITSLLLFTQSANLILNLIKLLLPPSLKKVLYRQGLIFKCSNGFHLQFPCCV